MTEMAKLEFGNLRDAWQGEASDFTPLLAEQLDALGDEIGINLASVGMSEVSTTGGRRIDIVANADDGSEYVVENQYGRGDHDHLTRGLAYAVARRARGLVVVAEEHRGEFRAVASYLNELAEHDPERSVHVWLVEAKAVRIDGGRWAPLFSTVIEPNEFTTTVEQQRQNRDRLASIDEFLSQYTGQGGAPVASAVVDHWETAGNRLRLGPDHVVLEAEGPSANGYRSVVALSTNGKVTVPFYSYGGANSGIEIAALTTEDFRSYADALFGLKGTERQARTDPEWLTDDTLAGLIEFCDRVAAAYADALAEGLP